MQTVDEMMAEAKALHDENIRLLAGIFFDKVQLEPGVSKDKAMAILKDDILRMKSLMKRYGRRADANRT